MKSKSQRLVRRNHARYHEGRDDLNIVPMIDMMVILVFFLIFTAVFSKTNILQLNLPASSTAVPDLPKGLKLEVIIRPDDIVVNDRNSGPLKELPNAGVGQFLQRTGIAIVHDDVVGTNDDFELEPLREVRYRRTARRQVQLQDIRLGKHGREDQEKYQDDHHVDHRHDIQIVAPLVVAGVIASD